MSLLVDAPFSEAIAAYCIVGHYRFSDELNCENHSICTEKLTAYLSSICNMYVHWKMGYLFFLLLYLIHTVSMYSRL